MNPFLKPYTTDYIPFDQIRFEHFKPAILQGIEEEDKEIEAIVSNPEPPTFANTIEAMENTGDILDRTTEVFYNLLSAETNDEMEELAEELSPIMTKHDNDISFNMRLFERVRSVYDHHAATDFEELTLEQRRLLDDTYKGFVRSGANLSDADKKRYAEITSELGVLGLQFSQNKLKETNAFTLHVTDKNEITGLPESAMELAAKEAKDCKKDGWIFTLQSPSYGPFMTYCDNAELRRQMYMAYNTICMHDNKHNNLEICRRLVNLRQEEAQLLGYASYADYVLEQRMAENADNVRNLLDQLLNAYKPQAVREVQEVYEYARTLGYDCKEIKPWDFGYYSNKLQEARYNINSELLRPYFPLEKVKEGVFALATRLYGITFHRNTEVPGYHSDVEAYDVYDKDGIYLALFYCDFFPRESKSSGAWMTNYRDQWIDDEGRNHRPIVSIVTNFMKPTDTKPSLLSLGEVETFLHEFGHSLHGMFANTRYASLSGTNVYWDFVELPSQIMENYSIEKEFLQTFAFHYKTGEPMPDELIERIVRSRNFNVAYACIRQVSYGLLDMAYYSLTSPLTQSIPEFEKQAWSRAQVLPQQNDTCMSVQFGHIMDGGYSAGYYSYKWAEVLDADAFSLFQEKGIFSTEVAESFRENVLSKGNTDHPATLYERFRGKAPSIKALLKRNGIITMICTLLCLVCLSCSRGDDINELFTGRTLYFTSATVAGRNLSATYPHTFYANETDYNITFNDHDYVIVLSKGNTIRGNWDADGKKRTLNMTVSSKTIEGDEMDAYIYNTVLSRIRYYSGDATFLTISADANNSIVLAKKRSNKSLI